MDILKINWEQTNFSDLPNNEDTYYYAFSRFDILLYIGITNRQNVKDEIRQTLQRLKINTTGLSIWLGYIDATKTTYGRITEQIVLDGECLMINTNRPTLNQQCKQSYTGRNNFCVKTSGCKYIRNCVRYENNKVYLTC